MRTWNLRVFAFVVSAGAMVGCANDDAPAPNGTIAMSLTGTASSGATYRLRDATLTVDGPTPTVFHTEDDPNRTSLSADVVPGDYAATLTDGWRIERLEDAGPRDVTATLVSDNPLLFNVAPDSRTLVPLKFRVEDDVIILGAGYDIVIDIDEGIPSPGDGYQAIDAPTPRTRLVYDSAGATLYALNVVDQEIERYHLVNGAWAAEAPVVVPGVNDIAITPDDTTLLVIDDTHVNDAPLGPDIVLTQRATLTDTFCGQFFAHVAAGANNKTFLTTGFRQCSGFSDSFIYDNQSHALTSSNFFFNGNSAASGDGSRIYIGSNGIFPPDNVTIYTPATNTFSSSSVAFDLFGTTVSDDASHVLAQNAAVFNRTLTLLGNIGPGGSATVSHDGRRAFVYRDDGPGPRVLVFDLEGPLGAGALFPLIHTIRLPHTASQVNGASAAILTTTSDDAQLFVSGDRRLLVVPTPAN